MSENIDSIRAQLWAKMRDKPYRDTFVAAHLSTNIAAQIQTLRETRGWKQKELAQKTDMGPARISVMENPSYDRFNLSTLRRLASAFDVALTVRFEPFSSLVNWVANLSPEKLSVPGFDQDSLSKPETQTLISPRAMTVASGVFGALGLGYSGAALQQPAGMYTVGYSTDEKLTHSAEGATLRGKESSRYFPNQVTATNALASMRDALGKAA
jgi:transcriptional regulator with XRE-family HTH domain